MKLRGLDMPVPCDKPWDSLSVISMRGLLSSMLHIFLLSMGSLVHLYLAYFSEKPLIFLKNILPLIGLHSLTGLTTFISFLIMVFRFFHRSWATVDVWWADHLGCSFVNFLQTFLQKMMYSQLVALWAIFLDFICFGVQLSSNSLTLNSSIFCISGIISDPELSNISIFGCFFSPVVFWLVLYFPIFISPFIGVERG